MDKDTKLVEAVIKTAEEKNGRKKLSCAEAFRLAEQFGIEIGRIGQICNDNNIRISDCQLGCFK